MASSCIVTDPPNPPYITVYLHGSELYATVPTDPASPNNPVSSFVTTVSTCLRDSFNPGESVVSGYILESGQLSPRNFTHTTSGPDGSSPYVIETSQFSENGNSVVSTTSKVPSSAKTANSNTVTPNTGLITPTQTSSPSSTANTTSNLLGSKSRDKQYDGGVVAGSAIGAAIGAALLAVVFTYICMRRRRSQHDEFRDPGDLSDMIVLGKSRGAQATHEDPRDQTGDSAWTKRMPHPVDDYDMARRVKTLYNQIELHVENFYQNANVLDSTILEDAQDALLSLESGRLPSSLPTSILHSPASTSVIKHTLSWLIISRISLSARPVDSFLPADYAGLTQIVKPRHNERVNSSFVEALAKYRGMTAYMQPDPSTNRSYLQKREANIRLAAETFTSAFERWTKDPAGDAESYLQNLLEIMRSAAELGVFVFAQPATFDFQWPEPARTTHQGQAVVTLPAFVKVTNDKGYMLETPAVMIREVVEDI